MSRTPVSEAMTSLSSLGDGVAEGAQAVAVEDGADVLAVGGDNHGRAVPGFHQAGMEFVKVLLFLGHGLVLFPGLGNHHQHGVVKAAAGHQQQFEGIVKAGGVAGAGGHNGRNLRNVGAKVGRLELGFAGAHPVEVAAQGVDFAVVGQVAVGVGQLPVAEGVGAEAGMHQGEGADQGRVVQVEVEPVNLVGHEQALVNQGGVGEAAKVKVVGVLFAEAAIGQGLLNDLAEGIELALQLFRFPMLRAVADKDLADGGLDGAGVAAQLAGVNRHVAPAEQGQPFGGNGAVNQVFAGGPRLPGWGGRNTMPTP